MARLRRNTPAEVEPARTRRYSRRTAQAITAAGTMDAATNGNGTNSSASKQAWQPVGWGYYDSCGALHYSANFVGACYSRIRLFVGRRLDDNTVMPLFTDDGQLDPDSGVDQTRAELARVILNSLKMPVGGQKQILKVLGKHRTVVGESFLVGHDLLGGTDGTTVINRSFEVLSTDELKPIAGARPGQPQYRRYYGGWKTDEDLPANTFVLRIYSPHPRFGFLADAPTRAALEIMEQIVLSIRGLKSSTISRLADRGILLVSDQLDFEEDDTAADDNESMHPLARDLIAIASIAKADVGSAAASVPLVVPVPGDKLSEAMLHIPFPNDNDDLALQKLDAMLTQFAITMDLPMEAVLGFRETTFANGVVIDESTYKAHLEPGLEEIYGALTAGFLWPQLLASTSPAAADVARDPNLPVPPEIEELVIWGDPVSLITHDGPQTHALDANKALIISDRAARNYIGYSEADAPSKEEIAAKVRRVQLMNVRETVRAEETGTGGISLHDPAVQDADIGAGADDTQQ